MKYDKGDLVVVSEGRDEGEVGIVIDKVAWYDGAHEMLVVLSEGKKKTWYVEHVRLANEEDRLSKGKGRTQE